MPLNFDDFERAARRVFEDIPAKYREGIDGLTVRKAPKPHPDFHGVYTLGECVTEAYPSDWTGPETLRSVVVLHWGSFRALSKLDPDFDWPEQIWETLTHELRHHLESLAARDDLTRVDYAMEQEVLRYEGFDFDPEYYRMGDRVGPGAYAVEDEVYLEQTWTNEDFRSRDRVSFTWNGQAYEVSRPDELGDVHFVRIVGGVPGPPYLQLVLVRRPRWLDRMRRAMFGGETYVLETDLTARRAGPEAEPNQEQSRGNR